MDFYALLAQVMDLLRSRGWVSYHALQRHSELDHAYLDDLKVELIDTQPLTRDENSSILVWLGVCPRISVSGSVHPGLTCRFACPDGAGF